MLLLCRNTRPCNLVRPRIYERITMPAFSIPRKRSTTSLIRRRFGRMTRSPQLRTHFQHDQEDVRVLFPTHRGITANQNPSVGNSSNTGTTQFCSNVSKLCSLRNRRTRYSSVSARTSLIATCRWKASCANTILP